MAQLDEETVGNLIISLMKAKFDRICRIIPSEYFHLDPINVRCRISGHGFLDTALEGKQELNAKETARLKRLWKKLVRMFYPDLHGRAHAPSLKTGTCHD